MLVPLQSAYRAERVRPPGNAPGVSAVSGPRLAFRPRAQRRERVTGVEPAHVSLEGCFLTIEETPAERGKPAPRIELGRRAYKARMQPSHSCWHSRARKRERAAEVESASDLIGNEVPHHVGLARRESATVETRTRTTSLPRMRATFTLRRQERCPRAESNCILRFTSPVHHHLCFEGGRESG